MVYTAGDPRAWQQHWSHEPQPTAQYFHGQDVGESATPHLGMMANMMQQDMAPSQSQMPHFRQAGWSQEHEAAYEQQHQTYQQQAMYTHQGAPQCGVVSMEGSYQNQGYAYDLEVEQQPSMQVAPGIRAVKELPWLFQGLFPFKYFNAVQSDCFDTVYNSDSNIVVAAPTGSGKTGVMELAIVRLLSQHLSSPNATSLDARSSAAGKVAYFAPTRALVQEKAKDWENRYGKLGVHVVELTGDADPDKSQLENADIICSTPEKFDSMTRKLNEGGAASFFGETSLVLIDEVHLLGEPGRGAALEAGVVSRIKMVSQWASMKQMPISHVRFVAVSATIPNVEDIAAWLNVQMPHGLHVYGEEMRSCKLRTIVKSYQPSKNDFLFERRLNDYVAPLIAEHSQQKPTLVFCSSRKGTTETAAHLAKQVATSGRAGPYVRDQAHAARLRAAANQTSQKQLKAVLEAGVGFHHAAMDAQDRALVESLFLAQDLPVLCTTSTLALGVNLPAHLVIIKGTRRYCGAGGGAPDGGGSSGYKEYDKAVCLQMVGRAGRPQFDKEGVAVIMTQRDTAARYQGLVDGAEEVESSLKECFAEHLNAEVVLRTIQDITQAIQWLKSTFLFVRMQRMPVQYGVPRDMLARAAASGGNVGLALEAYLRDNLVMRIVSLLVKHGLMSTDEDGFSLTATEPGKIMAHHYIALDTMVKVVSAPPSQGVPQLLGLMARAAELQHIHIRRGEKRMLQELHAAPLDKGGPRYPLLGNNGKRKDKIASAEEKIYVLLNEALADVPADKLDYSLKQEQEQMIRVAERVAAAMAKFYMHRGSFAAACNALQLVKSLRFRMWPDSVQQCRQLANVGRLTASRLAAAGMGDLRVLATADARSIEAAAQRFFPFGDQLKRELARSLPPVLAFQLLQARPSSDRSRVEVQLQLTRQQQEAAAGQEQQPGGSYARILVGSVADDRLLYQQSIVVESFTCPYQINVMVDAVKNAAGRSQQRLVACVLLDRSLGLDTIATFDLSADGWQAAAAGQQQQPSQPSWHDSHGAHNSLPQHQSGTHPGLEDNSLMGDRQMLSDEGGVMEIEMSEDGEDNNGHAEMQAGDAQRSTVNGQQAGKTSKRQRTALKAAVKGSGAVMSGNAAGMEERVVTTRLPPRPTFNHKPASWSAPSLFPIRTVEAGSQRTSKPEGTANMSSSGPARAMAANADTLPPPSSSHSRPRNVTGPLGKSGAATSASATPPPPAPGQVMSLDGQTDLTAQGKSSLQQTRPLLGGSMPGMYSRWASLSAKWTVPGPSLATVDTSCGMACDAFEQVAGTHVEGAKPVGGTSLGGAAEPSPDEVSCNDDGQHAELSRAMLVTGEDAHDTSEPQQELHGASCRTACTAVTAGALSISPSAAEPGTAAATRAKLWQDVQSRPLDLSAGAKEGGGSTSSYDSSGDHDGKDLLSSGSKTPTPEHVTPAGNTFLPDMAGSTAGLNQAMQSARGLLSLMPWFAQPAAATCGKAGVPGLPPHMKAVKKVHKLGCATPQRTLFNNSSIGSAGRKQMANGDSTGARAGRSSSNSSGGNGDAGSDRNGEHSGAVYSFGAQGAMSGGNRTGTPARVASPGVSFQLHAAGASKSPPATPVIWRAAATPPAICVTEPAGTTDDVADSTGADECCPRPQGQHLRMPASPAPRLDTDQQGAMSAKWRQFADIGNTHAAAAVDRLGLRDATTKCSQLSNPPAVTEGISAVHKPAASQWQADAGISAATDASLVLPVSSSKAILQQKLLGGGKQGMKRLHELAALQTKRARSTESRSQAAAPTLLHDHQKDGAGCTTSCATSLHGLNGLGLPGAAANCTGINSGTGMAASAHDPVQNHAAASFGLPTPEKLQQQDAGSKSTHNPVGNKQQGIANAAVRSSTLCRTQTASAGVQAPHSTIGDMTTSSLRPGRTTVSLVQNALTERPHQGVRALPSACAITNTMKPVAGTPDSAPSSSVIDPFMDLLCSGW